MLWASSIVMLLLVGTSLEVGWTNVAMNDRLAQSLSRQSM